MSKVTRRIALGLAGAGLLARPIRARAATAIEVFSSPFPPLTIDDPARPGFVNAVTLDLLRLLGLQGSITVLPWAETQRRGREEVGKLLTPPVRTPAREPNYTWIVKVLDITSSFAGRDAALDLEAARGVARLGVLRGSMHQAFLQQSGFGNLVEMGDLRELMAGVLEGRLDAMLSNTEDVRAMARQAGRAAEVRLGPPLLQSPVFIASGRNTGALPVADMRSAFAALEQDGTIEAHYRAYYGDDARRG